MGTKNKITYTKDMLIKDIANECGFDVGDVKEMYNKFADIITGYLSQANMEADVIVKLFDGVSFGSTFESATTKKNNFTGEDMIVPDKIKPKASFTRTFKNKLIDGNQ